MLKLIHIHKDYKVDKKPFPALKDINISFSDNGFVSILGPSGCGKTTLLNLIGGLDHYTSGDLLINGKSTKKFKDSDWDAYRNKRVGFVFQNYNLIPHLTLLENVEISLSLSGIKTSERHRRALELLDRVGLKEVANKKPSQLSGGQMQRVAIARSLVNNPEIVLADEPTGALDSKTSVQIMEILKEVSKDKLVIMVTHNEELANKYSTRIIKLFDGEIVDDSKPLVDIITDRPKNEKLKKTNMNFFQSIKMSGKSLLTKKGRTALTAIASSFGIIGVALVLAVQNGFTGYIGRVEASTASSLPITIAPYTTKSFLDDTNQYEQYPSDKNIRVYQPPTTQEIITHRNFITEDYVSYLESIRDDGLISSILYNHDKLDFNIVTNYGDRENTYIHVNQYSSASGASGVISAISGLPGSLFYELYGEKDYLETMYDTIDGRFPTEANEVVLVTNKYNQINLNIFTRLGIIIDPDNAPETISFEDLYQKEFKCFPNDVYFGEPTKVEEVDGYQLDIEAFEENVASQIAGGASTIDYDQALIHKDVTRTLTTYDNVDQRYTGRLNQLFNNTLPGKTLEEGKDFITLKIVGILRPREDSLLSLLPNSIGYTKGLKDFFVKANNESEVASNLRENWYIPRDDIHWDNFKTAIKLLTGQIDASEMSEQRINELVNGTYVFQDALGNERKMMDYLEACQEFGVDFPINKAVLDGSVSPHVIFSELSEHFVNYLAYLLGYSQITSIIIFPATLNAKEKILKRLDAYNKGKYEQDQIIYTDLIGTITNSIATMINVISVVLIVFSSISLLVSCVMTGIITYISVIERTKEIGILRAVGAKKSDVGRLFEAESMIIGFISGVIGVIVTYLVSILVNIILNNRFPDAAIGNIANLHPLHAFILVVISVVLTFISGFIPARAASRKDPVEALRSE